MISGQDCIYKTRLTVQECRNVLERIVTSVFGPSTDIEEDESKFCAPNFFAYADSKIKEIVNTEGVIEEVQDKFFHFIVHNKGSITVVIGDRKNKNAKELIEKIETFKYPGIIGNAFVREP